MVKGIFLSPIDDLTVCFDIRRRVFVEEKGISEDDEFDELDQLAMHILAFDDERPVATGRITLIDGIYTIGRIAVKMSERKKGFGDFVVRMLCNRAFQSGAKRVKLDAAVSAVGFYETIGFQSIGEVFLKDGGPHMTMWIQKDAFIFPCMSGTGCRK